jgi:5-methylthioadenosine/S-adenosylhomocysteine deaminase
MNTIITGTHVIFNDEQNKILSNSNIYIKDGVITDIRQGKYIKSFQGNIIDGRNSVVIPNFTNAHVHLGETIFRGHCDGMNLKEYLDLSHYPYELNEIKNEEEKIHSIVGKITLAEIIHSGTDCVACSRGQKEVAELGLKAICGIPIIYIEKLKKYYNNFFEIFKINYKNNNPNIRTGIFIQGLKTISNDILTKIYELRREYNELPIMIHLSETVDDVEYCIKNYKMTPIVFLNHIGLLTSNTICIHLVHITDEEIKLIKKSNAKPVFCPTANLYLSSGIPPIEKFYNNKIAFSIATDGFSISGSSSLLEQIKVVFSLFGGRIPINELFRSITKNPSIALGFDDQGEIKIGKNANISIFSSSPTSLFPENNILSQFINNNSLFHCNYMWSNGVPMLWDYKILKINESHLMEEGLRIVKYFEKREIYARN